MSKNSVPYKMPLALKIAFYIVGLAFLGYGGVVDLEMQQEHTGPYAIAAPAQP